MRKNLIGSCGSSNVLHLPFTITYVCVDECLYGNKSCLSYKAITSPQKIWTKLLNLYGFFFFFTISLWTFWSSNGSCVDCRNRNLSDFIKNIFICSTSLVPKMNESLMSLERHEGEYNDDRIFIFGWTNSLTIIPLLHVDKDLLLDHCALEDQLTIIVHV